MLKNKPHKKEIVVLFCLIAASCGIFFFQRTPSSSPYGKAAIDYNGERVAVLNLADYTEPVVVAMSDFGVTVPVHFELSNHQIRFVEAVCPDKLCEGFGFIGKPMQTAVCMPHRVAVSILED